MFLDLQCYQLAADADISCDHTSSFLFVTASVFSLMSSIKTRTFHTTSASPALEHSVFPTHLDGIFIDNGFLFFKLLGHLRHLAKTQSQDGITTRILWSTGDIRGSLQDFHGIFERHLHRRLHQLVQATAQAAWRIEDDPNEIGAFSISFHPLRLTFGPSCCDCSPRISCSSTRSPDNSWASQSCGACTWLQTAVSIEAWPTGARSSWCRWCGSWPILQNQSYQPGLVKSDISYIKLYSWYANLVFFPLVGNLNLRLALNQPRPSHSCHSCHSLSDLPEVINARDVGQEMFRHCQQGLLGPTEEPVLGQQMGRIPNGSHL